MKPTILLIEDNPDILRINASALAMRGYRVLAAETLKRGRELMTLEKPDILLLDILLPDGNGLAFCNEIREESGLPILILSALDETNDIIRGLSQGGDDYLTKPYDLDVLIARVEALLRRAGRGSETVVTKGAMTLDTVQLSALVGGEDAMLTPREFAILLFLVRNEGRDILAEELYETAWGQPMAGSVATVRTTVSRLRKKIAPAGFRIVSVRNVGYRLEEQ